MKCGTTSLAEILTKHSEIDFSTDKEPDFFSKRELYEKGERYYNKLFKSLETSTLIRGEASTSYSCYPYYDLKTAQKIFNHNPEMKLIYMLRDPIDRAISHYMHFYSRGFTKLSIEKALIEVGEIIDRSRYYLQLRPYLELFDYKNIKLVIFEEFRQDQMIQLKEITDFLGVKDLSNSAIAKKHSNKSLDKQRMPVKFDKFYNFIYQKSQGRKIASVFPQYIKTRINSVLYRRFSHEFNERPELSDDLTKMLARKVEGDVHEIEDLLGRKLSIWKTFYSNMQL